MQLSRMEILTLSTAVGTLLIDLPDTLTRLDSKDLDRGLLIQETAVALQERLDNVIASWNL